VAGKIHWRGLRLRIIAWSFIPTMIIMIVVAVFIFSAYANATRDLVVEQNRGLARLEANQYTDDLTEYENLLANEARILGVLIESTRSRPDALTSAANRLAVFDGGVALLDNYGRVTAMEPARADMLAADWSHYDFYNILAGSGSVSVVFSDVLVLGENGEAVIVVAVPVNSAQNHFVGVLAGMFHIHPTATSAFYGDIIKLNWSQGKNAFIVDSRGTVIYHTDTDQVGRNLSGLEAVRGALNGQSDALRTSDQAGQEVLASFAPIPGTSWGLVLEKTWSSLVDANQTYRTILLLLLALGVIVPAVIVYFGMNRVTRPIVEVSDAAREIAAGNFSHRIRSSTGDELEVMANQFNTMAGALEESYSTLEQRVRDRTRAERQRADQLRAVNEVGQRISSILDLDELLPFVTKSLQEAFNYYNVSISLDEGNGLSLKASTGARSNGDGTAPTRLAEQAAQTGEPAMVNDDLAEAGAGGLGRARSEIAAPIKIAGRTVGVLDFEESRADAFDEVDLFTAQTLADQLAIAIENARLYEHARELAATEERNRLARDLHDAVSQTLFSTSLIAEVLPRLWQRNPDEGLKRLEEVRQLTRGALAEMRTLLLELRPAALFEAELPHLLTQLGESVQGRMRAPVSVTIEGECDVPPDAKVALYRISQEALNNVAKHTTAENVSVELTCAGDRVTLTVTDDGGGFDMTGVPADSFGLGIMRERAAAIGAELAVTSEVGTGTRIRVEWKTPTGETGK